MGAELAEQVARWCNITDQNQPNYPTTWTTLYRRFLILMRNKLPCYCCCDVRRIKMCISQGVSISFSSIFRCGILVGCYMVRYPTLQAGRDAERIRLMVAKTISYIHECHRGQDCARQGHQYLHAGHLLR